MGGEGEKARFATDAFLWTAVDTRADDGTIDTGEIGSTKIFRFTSARAGLTEFHL
jgi:hypothetical protein